MRGSIVIVSLFFSLLFQNSTAQIQSREGWYRVSLLRNDGNRIVFNFELKQENGKPVIFIRNAAERLKADELQLRGDSLFIRMPFFESDIKAKLLANGNWSGSWTRGISTGFETMPFEAVWNDTTRMPSYAAPAANIGGKWQVTIIRPNGTPRPAVASFTQRGSYLEGTFLTPTGDYRFLEGTVSGDTMKLSCFDGSHAYYFSARITNNEISEGMFYSGLGGLEKWSARRDDNAALPDTVPVVKMKPGERRIDFSFKDLDGNTVSLRDERFRNKVVLVQIMGSWCPNCMDETAFLSAFYDQYRQRGVEVVSLAYELSTDEQRSRGSLLKFRNKFNVKYPMLITGVTVSDTKRTEKTLPQITPIRAFPTLIFIDRKGEVRDIHQGFYGPGAPDYFETFKSDFYRTVLGLLSEQQ